MKCWYSTNTGDEELALPGTAGTADTAGMNTGDEVVLHERNMGNEVLVQHEHGRQIAFNAQKLAMKCWYACAREHPAWFGGRYFLEADFSASVEFINKAIMCTGNA